MTSQADSRELDIPCPDCGKDFRKRVVDMKRKPSFRCPHCDADVDASQLVRRLQDADDEIQRLKRGMEERGFKNF